MRSVCVSLSVFESNRIGEPAVDESGAVLPKLCVAHPTSEVAKPTRMANVPLCTWRQACSLAHWLATGAGWQPELAEPLEQLGYADSRIAFSSAAGVDCEGVWKAAGAAIWGTSRRKAIF